MMTLSPTTHPTTVVNRAPLHQARVLPARAVQRRRLHGVTLATAFDLVVVLAEQLQILQPVVMPAAVVDVVDLVHQPIAPAVGSMSTRTVPGDDQTAALRPVRRQLCPPGAA